MVVSESVPVETQRRSVVIDGRRRRYVTVAPTGATGIPMVIVLHGSNQSARAMRLITLPGFDTLAASGAAAVAYPSGYRLHWNDDRASIGFAARKKGIDDVAFIRELIRSAVAEQGVDAARVYVVGFSNGGHMTARLAHEIPDLLAGVVVISATQPSHDNLELSADLHRPIPYLLIHGTKDPVSPYEGGVTSLLGMRPRGSGLSAPGTAEYWAERNGCRAPTTTRPQLTVDDDTAVEVTDYPGEAPVRFVTILGGGHQVPGGKHGPRMLGATSAQISAVEESRRFFDL